MASSPGDSLESPASHLAQDGSEQEEAASNNSAEAYDSQGKASPAGIAEALSQRPDGAHGHVPRALDFGQSVLVSTDATAFIDMGSQVHLALSQEEPTVEPVANHTTARTAVSGPPHGSGVKSPLTYMHGDDLNSASRGALGSTPEQIQGVSPLSSLGGVSTSFDPGQHPSPPRKRTSQDAPQQSSPSKHGNIFEGPALPWSQQLVGPPSVYTQSEDTSANQTVKQPPTLSPITQQQHTAHESASPAALLPPDGLLRVDTNTASPSAQFSSTTDMMFGPNIVTVSGPPGVQRIDVYPDGTVTTVLQPSVHQPLPFIFQESQEHYTLSRPWRQASGAATFPRRQPESAPLPSRTLDNSEPSTTASHFGTGPSYAAAKPQSVALSEQSQAPPIALTATITQQQAPHTPVVPQSNVSPEWLPNQPGPAVSPFGSELRRSSMSLAGPASVTPNTASGIRQQHTSVWGGAAVRGAATGPSMTTSYSSIPYTVTPSGLGAMATPVGEAIGLSSTHPVPGADADANEPQHVLLSTLSPRNPAHGAYGSHRQGQAEANGWADMWAGFASPPPVSPGYGSVARRSPPAQGGHPPKASPLPDRGRSAGGRGVTWQDAVTPSNSPPHGAAALATDTPEGQEPGSGASGAELRAKYRRTKQLLQTYVREVESLKSRLVSEGRRAGVLGAQVSALRGQVELAGDSVALLAATQAEKMVAVQKLQEAREVLDSLQAHLVASQAQVRALEQQQAGMLGEFAAERQRREAQMVEERHRLEAARSELEARQLGYLAAFHGDREQWELAAVEERRQLVAQCEEQIKHLCDEHEQQLAAAMRKATAEKEAAINEMRLQVEAAQAAHRSDAEAQSAALAAAQQQHAAQLAANVKQHAAELADLQRKMTAALDTTQEQKAAELAAAEERHRVELAASQSRHVAELAGARDVHAIERAAAQQEHSVKVLAAQEHHAAALGELREQHGELVGRLQEAEEALQAIRLEHEQAIQELRQQHAALLADCDRQRTTAEAEAAMSQSEAAKWKVEALTATQTSTRLVQEISAAQATVAVHGGDMDDLQARLVQAHAEAAKAAANACQLKTDLEQRIEMLQVALADAQRSTDTGAAEVARLRRLHAKEVESLKSALQAARESQKRAEQAASENSVRLAAAEARLDQAEQARQQQMQQAVRQAAEQQHRQLSGIVQQVQQDAAAKVLEVQKAANAAGEALAGEMEAQLGTTRKEIERVLGLLAHRNDEVSTLRGSLDHASQEKEQLVAAARELQGMMTRVQERMDKQDRRHAKALERARRQREQQVSALQSELEALRASVPGRVEQALRAYAAALVADKMAAVAGAEQRCAVALAAERASALEALEAARTDAAGLVQQLAAARTEAVTARSEAGSTRFDADAARRALAEAHRDLEAAQAECRGLKARLAAAETEARNSREVLAAREGRTRNEGSEWQGRAEGLRGQLLTLLHLLTSVGIPASCVEALAATAGIPADILQATSGAAMQLGEKLKITAPPTALVAALRHQLVSALLPDGQSAGMKAARGLYPNKPGAGAGALEEVSADDVDLRRQLRSAKAQADAYRRELQQLSSSEARHRRPDALHTEKVDPSRSRRRSASRRPARRGSSSASGSSDTNSLVNLRSNANQAMGRPNRRHRAARRDQALAASEEDLSYSDDYDYVRGARRRRGAVQSRRDSDMLHPRRIHRGYDTSAEPDRRGFSPSRRHRYQSDGGDWPPARHLHEASRGRCYANAAGCERGHGNDPGVAGPLRLRVRQLEIELQGALSRAAMSAAAARRADGALLVLHGSAARAQLLLEGAASSEFQAMADELAGALERTMCQRQHLARLAAGRRGQEAGGSWHLSDLEADRRPDLDFGAMLEAELEHAVRQRDNMKDQGTDQQRSVANRARPEEAHRQATEAAAAAVAASAELIGAREDMVHAANAVEAMAQRLQQQQVAHAEELAAAHAARDALAVQALVLSRELEEARAAEQHLQIETQALWRRLRSYCQAVGQLMADVQQAVSAADLPALAQQTLGATERALGLWTLREHDSVQAARRAVSAMRQDAAECRQLLRALATAQADALAHMAARSRAELAEAVARAEQGAEECAALRRAAAARELALQRRCEALGEAARLAGEMGEQLKAQLRETQAGRAATEGACISLERQLEEARAACEEAEAKHAALEARLQGLVAQAVRVAEAQRDAAQAAALAAAERAAAQERGRAAAEELAAAWESRLQQSEGRAAQERLAQLAAHELALQRAAEQAVAAEAAAAEAREQLASMRAILAEGEEQSHNLRAELSAAQERRRCAEAEATKARGDIAEARGALAKVEARCREAEAARGAAERARQEAQGRAAEVKRAAEQDRLKRLEEQLGEAEAERERAETAAREAGAGMQAAEARAAVAEGEAREASKALAEAREAARGAEGLVRLLRAQLTERHAEVALLQERLRGTEAAATSEPGEAVDGGVASVMTGCALQQAAARGAGAAGQVAVELEPEQTAEESLRSPVALQQARAQAVVAAAAGMGKPAIKPYATTAALAVVPGTPDDAAAAVTTRRCAEGDDSEGVSAIGAPQGTDGLHALSTVALGVEFNKATEISTLKGASSASLTDRMSLDAALASMRSPLAQSPPTQPPPVQRSTASSLPQHQEPLAAAVLPSAGLLPEPVAMVGLASSPPQGHLQGSQEQGELDGDFQSLLAEVERHCQHLPALDTMLAALLRSAGADRSGSPRHSPAAAADDGPDPDSALLRSPDAAAALEQLSGSVGSALHLVGWLEGRLAADGGREQEHGRQGQQQAGAPVVRSVNVSGCMRPDAADRLAVHRRMLEAAAVRVAQARRLAGGMAHGEAGPVGLAVPAEGGEQLPCEPARRARQRSEHSGQVLSPGAVRGVSNSSSARMVLGGGDSPSPSRGPRTGARAKLLGLGWLTERLRAGRSHENSEEEAVEATLRPYASSPAPSRGRPREAAPTPPASPHPQSQQLPSPLPRSALTSLQPLDVSALLQVPTSAQRPDPGSASSIRATLTNSQSASGRCNVTSPPPETREQSPEPQPRAPLPLSLSWPLPGGLASSASASLLAPTAATASGQQELNLRAPYSDGDAARRPQQHPGFPPRSASELSGKPGRPAHHSVRWADSAAEHPAQLCEPAAASQPASAPPQQAPPRMAFAASSAVASLLRLRGRAASVPPPLRNEPAAAATPGAAAAPSRTSSLATSLAVPSYVESEAGVLHSTTSWARSGRQPLPTPPSFLAPGRQPLTPMAPPSVSAVKLVEASGLQRQPRHSGPGAEPSVSSICSTAPACLQRRGSRYASPPGAPPSAQATPAAQAQQPGRHWDWDAARVAATASTPLPAGSPSLAAAPQFPTPHSAVQLSMHAVHQPAAALPAPRSGPRPAGSAAASGTSSGSRAGNSFAAAALAAAVAATASTADSQAGAAGRLRQLQTGASAGTGGAAGPGLAAALSALRPSATTTAGPRAGGGAWAAAAAHARPHGAPAAAAPGEAGSAEPSSTAAAAAPRPADGHGARRGYAARHLQARRGSGGGGGPRG